MSLIALQRQDPYINKLLDVTGHVALYNFNSKVNEWVSFSKDAKQFPVLANKSMLMLAPR